MVKQKWIMTMSGGILNDIIERIHHTTEYLELFSNFVRSEGLKIVVIGQAR